MVKTEKHEYTDRQVRALKLVQHGKHFARSIGTKGQEVFHAAEFIDGWGPGGPWCTMTFKALKRKGAIAVGASGRCELTPEGVRAIRASQPLCKVNGSFRAPGGLMGLCAHGAVGEPTRCATDKPCKHKDDKK